MDTPGSNEELVQKRELDELRRYVRQGRPGFIWPVHVRRIYPADFVFADGKSPAHQVLHEWDLLVIPTMPGTQTAEFYAVIAVFGVEYAINLGGPELSGFVNWLQENAGISYLYAKCGGPHPPGALPC